MREALWMEEGHFLFQHILFTRNRMTFTQKKRLHSLQGFVCFALRACAFFFSNGIIGPFIILFDQLITYAWWPCGAVETTPSTFLSGLIKENNCAIRVCESGVRRGAFSVPGSTRLMSAQRGSAACVGDSGNRTERCKLPTVVVLLLYVLAAI